MYEHFEFRRRRSFYRFYFFETEFSREDDALDAFPAQKIYARRAFDVHLRRRVQFHRGEKLLRHADDGEILHDEPVGLYPVEVAQEPIQLFRLVLFAHRVDRNVYFFAEPMKGIDSRFELIPCKIRRAKPRVKAFESEIYRIGSFADSRIERFDITRRRQ